MYTQNNSSVVPNPIFVAAFCRNVLGTLLPTKGKYLPRELTACICEGQTMDELHLTCKAKL